ncbi:MAG: guanylate kinase [Brevinema sp.]
MGKVIVISGPSGVGKTSLYKKVLETYKDRLDFCVSATTRAMRDSEENGRDYHFLTEDEFKYLLASGEFIESERLYGNYYGTLRSEVTRIWDSGKTCLLDIDVKGGLKVHDLFPDQSTLIFIAPPSYAELESRLRLRGDNDEDSLNKRLSIANDEMAEQVKYDYVLVNENFETTLTQLCETIEIILAK